ncbi:outer membrane beta-barrel protein [uncultured Parabacteroides sp.]|uniref:outer membrane beta-barrel protein n=1 Tax=uncultured Parabacteroides sp. TaxID=512312 RepID=UPI002609F2A1|nr:outer membrane beta-barrel protein [uncultured Parabacteroides sp.]
MKQIIMVALLIPFSWGIRAQQLQIRGKVVDLSGKSPLEFANITLQTADSAFVTGTTTDSKGLFRIEKVEAGDYHVSVSSIGYKTSVVSVLGLSRDIDLGTILLASSSISLDEVTVSASAIRNTSDRKIAFPTPEQKAASSNGINLLSALMLPRLQVDPIRNSVSLPNEGSIQYRINGIKVELSDIRGLSPQEVIRVEYHDNPGLRYGDASVVLDYIVRREISGGSVNLDLSNSPTTSFGDDQVSAKFNHKKSEFGLRYAARYRNPYHIWTEGAETFRFENGETLERTSEGLPKGMSESTHDFSFNYNLVDNDHYYFNATLRYTLSDEDKGTKKNLYTNNRPEDKTYVWNPNNNSTQCPSLDLYFQRTLPHKQMLVLNMVGTYINTNASQMYQEWKNDILLSDILSNIDGDKYSIIGEGIYERQFETSRLGGGLRHTQSWTDNSYSGTVEGRTKMRQAETYLYTEFSGKAKKLSYTVGIGVSRSWFRQEGEEDYRYYTFRPKVSLQYDFTNDMYFRVNGSINNVSPSLSELSAIEQYIDTLQIRRGNPYLKPYKSYDMQANYLYKKGIFTGDLNFYYSNSPYRIMEEIIRENDKFICVTDNQKRWQQLSGDLTLRIGPIVKRIVSLSVTGGVNRYISEGNSYSHIYTNWYYRASIMALYKRFMAMFQIQSSYNRFVGETLIGGENIHMFMLRYNHGKFAVGAGLMMPFSKQYKRVEENRNAYASSYTNMYANDFSRMLMLTFSWNLDFGRKFKEGNKKLWNSDKDPGIMR